jgi:hypothetical protein
VEIKRRGFILELLVVNCEDQFGVISTVAPAIYSAWAGRPLLREPFRTGYRFLFFLDFEKSSSEIHASGFSFIAAATAASYWSFIFSGNPW